MSLPISIFDEVLRLKYKGVLDFEGLYKLIRKWFNERGYDYMEPKYKDKAAGPFGNEVELKMQGEKKVTDFIKYHVQIEIIMIELKEFDAKIDGHVKKVTNGRIFIDIAKVECEFDWQNRFQPAKKPDSDDLFSVISYNFKEYTSGPRLLKLLVTKLLKRYYEIKYLGPLEAEALDLHEKIKKHMGHTTTELQ